MKVGQYQGGLVAAVLMIRSSFVIVDIERPSMVFNAQGNVQRMAVTVSIVIMTTCALTMHSSGFKSTGDRNWHHMPYSDRQAFMPRGEDGAAMAQRTCL